MRLLEFVPCGRRAASRLPPPTRATRSADEVDPLSAATPAAPEKLHRRAGPGPVAQWRPSLSAIYEDGVAGAATAGKGGERTARPVKPKTGKRPVVGRAERDDFGHFRAPTVVPSFAPTAFLF